MMHGAQGLIKVQPLGTTLVILPWNFPFWLAFKSALAPLILGNPVLLKHSPSTPQCALMIEQAMQQAGFNDGEFQNIFASNDQCADLIGDKRVQGVKFTGSTAAGVQVSTLCGKHMKKGHFELGGNDPFIVLKDADLPKAALTAYRSRMGANAQACINAKRFIVEDSVYDDFKHHLIEVIKEQTVIGDPTDEKTTLGPLALDRQKSLLISQVAQAQKDGAKLVYGSLEDHKMSGDLSKGNYVHPIVTEGLSMDSESYHAEFFGPVFNLYKGSSPAQCLEMANKSDYGLAGTVFSENLDLAMDLADKM